MQIHSHAERNGKTNKEKIKEESYAVTKNRSVNLESALMDCSLHLFEQSVVSLGADQIYILLQYLTAGGKIKSSNILIFNEFMASQSSEINTTLPRDAGRPMNGGGSTSRRAADSTKATKKGKFGGETNRDAFYSPSTVHNDLE